MKANEKKKEYMKQYNKTHKEKIKIAQKKYYENHKEYFKQFNRSNYKELQQRIEKALHLITHSDITDYRVFNEELLEILRGEENENKSN